jgi:ABC-type lipoprotein release transport system permease subunit
MTMRSLSGLGIRTLAERRGRLVMIGVGIALGVALLTGALTATGSISRALDGLGGTRAVVLPPADGGTAGIPQSMASAAQRALPGVEHAAPWLQFGTSVRTSDGKVTAMRFNQGAPAVFVGIDPGDAGRFHLRLDPGPATGDDLPRVVVTRHLARSLAIAAGQTLTVATPSGNREVRVADVVADTPDIDAPDAVVAPLDTAQPGRESRADLPRRAGPAGGYGRR